MATFLMLPILRSHSRTLFSSSRDLLITAGTSVLFIGCSSSFLMGDKIFAPLTIEGALTTYDTFARWYPRCLKMSIWWSVGLKF